MKVYVTGLGVVSAIGLDVAENFYSLKMKKSGIKKINHLALNKNICLGVANCSNEEIIEKYKLTNGPYSRTSLLGYIAAKEAWGENSCNKNIRTGFISATSVGGMDRSEEFYRQLIEKSSIDLSLIVTHDSGNTTEKIAKELSITGYVNTLSTACSSGANSIMLGARLIAQNKLDRVLIGGTDALTLFTINGFHSLFIYDAEFCKPFDENRNGLNLGEGAAYLVIENEKSIGITGNEIYCMISGWHNAADGYHQTASSPEGNGAALAMLQAINKSELAPADISYINAHGTGTKNNDTSESNALKYVFGENIPLFSSTKAYTGHALAAAGAIEAVYSVLAIENNAIFPNLNFETPILETGLNPQVKFKSNSIVKSVLSNSFGFGGNCTSLVFKKI